MSDRLSEIIRRHQAGERGSDIARALGVSRQYVSAMIKQHALAAAGGVVEPKPRGRPKDLPLTVEESAALCDYLQAGQKGDGIAADLSSEKVTAWFRETFGRTLTVHQLRKVCTKEGLKLAPPDCSTTPESDGQGVLQPRRGRPRKGFERADPEKLSARELAAMERSNAEMAERIAAQREEAKSPKPVHNAFPKIARNDPCPFDPGKKFKRCCGADGAKWCLRQANAADGES